MGRNSLNGSIPAGFLNMPLARIIELNNNNFTGELPSTISGNVLEILSLNNNFITGGIPGQFKTCANYKSLCRHEQIIRRHSE